MSTFLKLTLASAAVLLCAAAAAQPPNLKDALPPGFFPEGAIVGEPFECPDPPEQSHKPECCRVTIDVDTAGAVTHAEAKCTFKPLEAVSAVCAKSQRQDIQMTKGKPEAYSLTFFQENYPAVRQPSDLLALRKDAAAACDTLR